jgi:hypothetical protein
LFNLTGDGKLLELLHYIYAYEESHHSETSRNYHPKPLLLLPQAQLPSSQVHTTEGEGAVQIPAATHPSPAVLETAEGKIRPGDQQAHFGSDLSGTALFQAKKGAAAGHAGQRAVAPQDRPLVDRPHGQY